jgi:serine/threonine protein kinase
MELMKGSLEGKRLHRSQIVVSESCTPRTPRTAPTAAVAASVPSVFLCDALQSVMRQLCSALAYLHDDAGVVHNDIKPSNILFARLGRAPLVKLGDFGLAQHIKQTSARGTVGFMAPDVKRGRRPTPASDVWSLGVTLVELCTGTPFDPSSGFSISTSLRQLFCDDVLLCDLVDRMLELNPHKRITAAQALRHPFLNSKQAQWDKNLLSKRDALVAAVVRVLPVVTVSCPDVRISDL